MSFIAENAERLTAPRSLATEEPVGRSTGWWGMVLLVATESMVFAAFFGSYFYLRFYNEPHWPPPGIHKPDLTIPFIMTGLLLVGSAPIFVGGRAAKYGRSRPLRLGLSVVLLFGLAFLAMQGLEYSNDVKKYTPTTHVYGSLVYTITGLHDVHVIVGVAIAAWLLIASLRGRLGPTFRDRMTIAAIYWYFVDVAWIGVLFTVYLSVYI